MGNCCKVTDKKKTKEIIRSNAEAVTIAAADKSQKQSTLLITCSSLNLNISLQYRPKIPLSDLKEQILSRKPEIDMSKYTLFRGDLEILDPTATIQQLGIVPGDCLKLTEKEELNESEDIIASENNSVARPYEETKLGDVNMVNSKKGMVARNEGTWTPKKSANELWRTSLPSPPSRPLIQCEQLEASSMTNNTQDKSLKANQPAICMRFLNGISESEEKIEKKLLLEEVDEGKQDFTDLRSPFHIFQD